jgi:hypothetical protein
MVHQRPVLRGLSLHGLHASAPRWLGALAAVALLLAPSASLAEGGVAGIDEEWSYQFTPYLWALSLKGDIDHDGVETDVDASFSDILDLLNFGVMGTGEVRKGRWFFGFDGLFAELEDEIDAGPGKFSFGPTTLSKGPLSVDVPGTTVNVGPADVDVRTTLAIVKLDAGYRLLSTPLGSETKPRPLSIDAYLGGRYWYLKNRVHIQVPPVQIPGIELTPFLDTPFGQVQLPGVSIPGTTLGGIDTRVSESTHHFDPLVGLRVQHDFADNWSATLAGDVGGFGIGSAADFSWEALAQVSWRFGERWALVVGYRALGIDRDGSSGNNIDITIHGPKIGATYSWGGSRR